MSSWPVDVELEAAPRPERDDHSHHRVRRGKRTGNKRLRRRIDVLEVLELLVDPAEQKIPLLTCLSLGAALFLRGFIGSHPCVGRGGPEIDVIDPVLDRRLVQPNDEGVEPIRDSDCLGRAYAQDLVHEILSPIQRWFLAGTSRGEKRLRGRPRRHGRLLRHVSIPAPADTNRVPADYRAAAEFIARNDSYHPALAVKNGDGRD